MYMIVRDSILSPFYMTFGTVLAVWCVLFIASFQQNYISVMSCRSILVWGGTMLTTDMRQIDRKLHDIEMCRVHFVTDGN
jgi:hypothetical protein